MNLTDNVGSASPAHWPQDDFRSSDSVGSIHSLGEYSKWSEVQRETSFPAMRTEPLKLLGHISAMSQPTRTANLDWALIHIDSADFNSSIIVSSKIDRVRNVAVTLTGRRRVEALTASNGCVIGILTGSSTFVQLPDSSAFQEMWAVQLDGPLGRF
jgi:hypothetical protein